MYRIGGQRGLQPPLLELEGPRPLPIFWLIIRYTVVKVSQEGDQQLVKIVEIVRTTKPA